MQIPPLTRAQEDIMQMLWDYGMKFTIRETYDNIPEPKPKFNYFTSVLYKLEKKKYLSSFERKMSIAMPDDFYKRTQLSLFIKTKFNGSYIALLDFMVAKNKIGFDELTTALNKLKQSQLEE